MIPEQNSPLSPEASSISNTENDVNYISEEDLFKNPQLMWFKEFITEEIWAVCPEWKGIVALKKTE